VSPAKVREMAGRYFDSSNLVVVLVGNVKEFRDSIRKEFPKAGFEDLAFGNVNLLAPDLRSPAK